MRALFKFFSFMVIAMSVYSGNEYGKSKFADTNRIEKIRNTLPQIAAIYQKYAKTHHFPGFAFGILIDGKLIYSENHGYANLEDKIPFTSHSLFRIASLTKSFTAMAILQLRDQGKLRLDDPISMYVPELQNKPLTTDAPPITIRDLLTHGAGLPSDNPWGDRHLDMSTVNFKNFLKKDVSLANVPGVHYEYSNLGFALLGLVIEQVTGIPYQEYVAKYIWQPLAMTDVQWNVTKIPAQQLALGYRWENASWHQEPMLADGAFAAMGGMISSLDAFSHYIAFFQQAWPPRNGQESGPLKRSSLREMQQAWRFDNLNSHYQFLNGHQCALVTAYGYGLKWLKDCLGRTYVGHSGGLPGFGSNWFIMPDYGIGVVLFANSTYAPAAEINLEVLDELITKAQLQPMQLAPTPLLKGKQQALLKLLQNWNMANARGLVASNFFPDLSLEARKKQTTSLLQQIGKIIHVSEVIPLSQLSGTFTIEGEHGKVQVDFMLSPDNPPLIQEIHIK